MLDAVSTRLQAQVSELSGRVGKAAEFSKLMARRGPLTGGVNAFVVPGSKRGGQASAAAGTFSQQVQIGVTVVLFLSSVDAHGARALERIEDLLTDIEAALCGWAPGDEVGVFELSQSKFAPGGDGTLSWVIDFRIMDHLEVST